MHPREKRQVERLITEASWLQRLPIGGIGSPYPGGVTNFYFSKLSYPVTPMDPMQSNGTMLTDFWTQIRDFLDDAEKWAELNQNGQTNMLRILNAYTIEENTGVGGSDTITTPAGTIRTILDATVDNDNRGSRPNHIIDNGIDEFHGCLPLAGALGLPNTALCQVIDPPVLSGGDTIESIDNVFVALDVTIHYWRYVDTTL